MPIIIQRKTGFFASNSNAIFTITCDVCGERRSGETYFEIDAPESVGMGFCKYGKWNVKQLFFCLSHSDLQIDREIKKRLRILGKAEKNKEA